jgi:hydrogenase maturation protease
VGAGEWLDRVEAGADSSVLVLGLGNDILTDDAVGLVIAREMRRRFADHPEVAVVDSCEMGLSLLDFIAGHRDLIVVDSVQSGRASPGHLHEVGEEDIKTLPGMSPHFLGVGEILALGRLLGLPMPGRVKLFAVEVADPFTLGTNLSETVALALPEILERVTARVAEWSAGGGTN